MKKSILALLAGIFAVTSHAAPIYYCSGGSFSPIKIEIKPALQIVINDVDYVKAEAQHLPYINLHVVRLQGLFSSLGDGTSEHKVDVIMSKSLLGPLLESYMCSKF
jgi:hypothetical protein